MKKFRILETEETLDCMESLIGTEATLIGMERGYYNLETLDGPLLFTEEEIEEV